MKTIARILSVLFILTMLIACASSCAVKPTVDVIKERGTLIMLTNAGFPPFEYTSGGEVVGADVDIAQEIAKELGVKLEIKDMAFEGIVNAIKSGKGDIGVAGMSIDETRLKNVDFSVEYVKSKLMVLVRKNETAIKTPDDLTGKKIGVQTGTTSDVFASDIEDATLSRYGTFLDAATALKAGKVDAVVVDSLTSDEILAANSELSRLEASLAEEAYAICVQKGNKTLLEAVNTVLNRLLQEGKIDQFIFNHTAGKSE